MASSSTASGSNINYEGTSSNSNDIKEAMNSTSKNNDISEDHVTVFVAYDEKWEYDGKEWFFKNSKGSMLVVPKHITLSEMTDILHDKICVNKLLYRLKLEVHWTGSPWFPVIEIQNDKDHSVFISETLKKELPLCVTRLKKDKTDVINQLKKNKTDEIGSDDDEMSSDVGEERQKV
nr:ankyrin repeat family protein [Tanacetum cinerariifolium]